MWVWLFGWASALQRLLHSSGATTSLPFGPLHACVLLCTAVQVSTTVQGVCHAINVMLPVNGTPRVDPHPEAAAMRSSVDAAVKSRQITPQVIATFRDWGPEQVPLYMLRASRHAWRA